MSTEEKFQSTENISEHSLPTNDILILIDDAQVLLDKFLDSLDQSLNTTRRLRLNGIGISRYGFTNKVSDVASENMRFAPATFSDTELKALIRRIELLRNLSSLLRQCVRIVNDELLITGDEAYAMALLYYNTLREQARARVLGADEVFRMLEPFFRRHRRIPARPSRRWGRSHASSARRIRQRDCYASRGIAPANRRTAPQNISVSAT